MVSNLFSDIPNNQGVEPLPAIPDHPFGPNEKGVSQVHHFSHKRLSFATDYGGGANDHVLPRYRGVVPTPVPACDVEIQTCQFLVSFGRPRGPWVIVFLSQTKGLVNQFELWASESGAGVCYVQGYSTSHPGRFL